jgi:hypothetical protein
VKFKITPHSGSQAPEDALDLLAARLGPRREEITFVRIGGEIRATVSEDAPVSMTQDERQEIGRRKVLDVVLEICERVPDLKAEWYAVSPKPGGF